MSFFGGCIAGIVGAFAVAVMSEMFPNADSPDDLEHDGEQTGTIFMPESNNSGK